MKLSKRLKHIELMVENDYAHIWDCCCDHGFLGTSLLKKRLDRTIHFVDIVPELISTLESKLEQFYPQLKSNWQSHCIDVSKLPLSEYQGKHLIIIAGIGGDLMTRMIDALHTDYPDLDIDFLLCPVNRQFAVREKLIELNFSLKDEKLTEDKDRFYEILLLSSKQNKDSKVSNVGEKIWLTDSNDQTQIAKAYLDKTLGYYQAIQKSNSVDIKHITNAYKSVSL